MNKKIIIPLLIFIIFMPIFNNIPYVYAYDTRLYTHTGFEGGDLHEVYSSTGTVSVQSTTKKTGDYALKSNPTSDVGYVIVKDSGAKQTTFYMLIDTAPDTEVVILGDPDHVTDSGNVRLTSDRKLKLYSGDTIKITGTTTLSLDTWYRISVYTQITYGYALYIDGELEGSASGEDDYYWQIGIATTTTAIIYFDNFASGWAYVGGLNDIGDIHVLASKPNTDELVQFDTPIPPEIHHLNVDELPYNDDDENEHTASTIATDRYGIQDANTIGIGSSDIIYAVSTWYRMKRDGGSATTHQSLIYDGSEYTTTRELTTSFTWYNRYDSQKPSGGDWTQTVFNNIQIGAKHADTGGQDTHISACWSSVAFLVEEVGEHYYRTPTDSSDISISLTRVLVLTRSWVDTVSISDVLSRTTVLTRSFTDASSVISNIIKDINKYLISSVNINDPISRIIVLTRILTTPSDINDILSRVIVSTRGLTASVNINDIITAIKGIFRTISESININDSINRAIVLSRTLIISVNISDVSDRIGVFIRNLLDNISIDDIITAVKGFFRNISDSINIDDTISRVTVLIRSLSDNISVTPVISRVLDITRIINDIVSIADEISAELIPAGEAFFRLMQDTTYISDNIEYVFKHLTEYTVYITNLVVSYTRINAMINVFVYRESEVISFLLVFAAIFCLIFYKNKIKNRNKVS